VSFDLSPDPLVLSHTIAVAVFTAILFALAPAWRASRQDPAAVLQQGARALSGGTGRLSRILIVTQVALSMVLLLGAGLLVSSFEKLRTLHLGFQKESILQIALYPRPGGYQNLDLKTYHQQLLEGVSAIPGVRSVGFSDLSIPSPDAWHDFISEASADQSTAAHIFANAANVSPGFFQTLAIPLLRGRVFNDLDDEHHPRVAILSAALASRLFPNSDALGKSIRFGVMTDYQNLQIVGIAADARLINLRDPSPPILYVSSLQYPRQWGYLLVRTAESPDTVAKPIAQHVDSLGREYALTTQTITEVVSSQLTEERVTALLSGFFAALALLLASIGLYGLMSYAVTRRTRELGIRVAIGAQRQNILWIVLRETLALALIGLAIGIPCAISACRLISSMLFGLSPSDLPTIAVVSLLLLLVALFAGYLPARRASAIDPIVALRAE
jgi:predicted permease